MDILVAAALAFVALIYAAVPDANAGRSGEPTEDAQAAQPDDGAPSS